jgi:hypothetical protein
VVDLLQFLWSGRDILCHSLCCIIRYACTLYSSRLEIIMQPLIVSGNPGKVYRRVKDIAHEDILRLDITVDKEWMYSIRKMIPAD